MKRIVRYIVAIGLIAALSAPVMEAVMAAMAEVTEPSNIMGTPGQEILLAVVPLATITKLQNQETTVLRVVTTMLINQIITVHQVVTMPRNPATTVHRVVTTTLLNRETIDPANGLRHHNIARCNRL